MQKQAKPGHYGPGFAVILGIFSRDDVGYDCHASYRVFYDAFHASAYDDGDALHPYHGSIPLQAHHTHMA